MLLFWVKGKLLIGRCTFRWNLRTSGHEVIILRKVVICYKCMLSVVHSPVFFSHFSLSVFGFTLVCLTHLPKLETRMSSLLLDFTLSAVWVESLVFFYEMRIFNQVWGWGLLLQPLVAAVPTHTSLCASDAHASEDDSCDCAYAPVIC